MRVKAIISLALIITSTIVMANNITAESNKIHGKLISVQLTESDTLEDIAQRYDVAYDEILDANPSIVVKKLQVGDVLTIPSQRLFLTNKKSKIVVNLTERRLYFIDGSFSKSYPVAIGRQGWHTPLGLFSVIDKKYKPSWYVPKDIHEEFASQGIILPEVVPPGPDNPLGEYLMRLSMPSYLIHGTNNSKQIGKKTTSGCVSLYPHDIRQLYEKVRVGDNVSIINAPIKWYKNHNQLCVEVHPLVYDKHNVEKMTSFMNNFSIDDKDREYWNNIFSESLGVPQCVEIRSN